jgi:hypothetical protein
MDYTLYLWHVLIHRLTWLWRFHLPHHVDLDLDADMAGLTERRLSMDRALSPCRHMLGDSPREHTIKDYAIIGNCETAALINPDGGIDWLCLPAFDAPSYFAALLDREKGGEFFIRPRCRYRVEREYIEDSAILQTRFVTAAGEPPDLEKINRWLDITKSYWREWNVLTITEGLTKKSSVEAR